MAKQLVNLGSAPAGAGGDDRRSAWLKAISNFNELYAALGAPANGTIPAGTAASALINGDPAAGALMRAGSNSAGYYFQFNSGLLICIVAFTGYTANVVKTVAWPFQFVPNASVAVSCSITPSTGYENSSPTYWGTPSSVNFASGLTRGANTVVMTGIGWWK